MAAASSPVAEARQFVHAWLRGCAQLAFCDSPAGGLLVLAGITLVAPLAGVGTVLGALFGTIVGRASAVYPRDEWVWGLAGFNPAIVGLMWGGLFASGEQGPALLAASLAASVVFDLAFRRLLGRYQLPALSSAAVTTIYVTSFVFAPAGAWLWIDAPGSAFLPYGLVGAALVVLAAMLKAPFAAAWAILLAAIALAAGVLAGYEPAATVGLWAVTIPLASFGMHAVFLRGSLAGCAAGTLAAAFAAVVWIAWQGSPIGGWLPPLVTPFIFGVWLSFLSMRVAAAHPAAQPGRWQILRSILAARREGREVVALVQGIADTPVSGFVSGTWLDPQWPRSAFAPEQLRASAAARRALWDAAERVRAESQRLPSTSLSGRIGKLRAAGWIDGLVVQDIMWPRDVTTSRAAFSVHGDLDGGRCLDCSDESPWPPRGLWRRCDLRCAKCQGPVAPDITLFGSEPDAATTSRLADLATRCGVLVVLGDEAAEPATQRFIDRVRESGGIVAFVSDKGIGYARRPADVSVAASPESCLAFLEASLGVAGLLSRGLRPRAAREREAALDAAKQGGGTGT